MRGGRHVPEIRSILDRYDLGGIGEGAPEDEYDSEAQKIARGLGRCADEGDVVSLIHAVFIEQFGESVADEDVRAAASEIWALRT